MTERPAGDTAVVELALAIVPEPGAELDEVDRAGRQLRAELIELDVESVAVSSGEPPAGAKGADWVAISELIVTLSASGGVLATVVAGVRDWLQRRSDAHRVTLTIGEDTVELAKASPAERAALLAAFVARHST